MRMSWSKTVPKAYQLMLDIEHFAEETSLEPRLKELVKIRASQLNGCAHCLDMHTKDARALRETEQRIYVLSAWREAPFYSPRERAALEWCESLTLLSESGAPDEVYAGLEQQFSPQEIVELTLVIVVINSWNRLAVGFRSNVGDYVSRKKTREVQATGK